MLFNSIAVEWKKKKPNPDIQFQIWGSLFQFAAFFQDDVGFTEEGDLIT